VKIASSTVPQTAGGERKIVNAVVHPFGFAPDSVLGRRFERWAHAPYFSPLVAAFPVPVARVEADARTLADAEQGLPQGPGRPEAMAVRLRRAGVQLDWGAPEPFHGAAALLRRQHELGASSVEMLRADPSLLPELRIGSWFHASARTRMLRRALARLPLRRFPFADEGALAILADAAFWGGVRQGATPREWERLTKCSYVCVYYHQIADHKTEPTQGHDRLVVTPRRLRRQLALLRLLKFRPLSGEEVAAFHSDPVALLPRRSYVVTADDGFKDATAALERRRSHRPQLFVPTARVGGTATWAGGEPLASWDELRGARGRGVEVGSHGRRHVPLTGLDERTLHEELTGSLRELDAQLSHPLRALAYPHGLHDETVRSAARTAGYALAYTTRPGRNGAGTDPYCLRRIGLKDRDGGLSLLWKVLTGEHSRRERR
jgi:peptidoglycan/xylan/chitin deacetylase (PgdA/CDA1 family)